MFKPYYDYPTLLKEWMCWSLDWIASDGWYCWGGWVDTSDVGMEVGWIGVSSVGLIGEVGSCSCAGIVIGWEGEGVVIGWDREGEVIGIGCSWEGTTAGCFTGEGFDCEFLTGEICCEEIYR